MTNIDALKSKVAGYPIDDNSFNVALIDRGLNPHAPYEGKSKMIDLATADIYIVLLTAANISEGDYQISLTDKSNFMKVASKLYEKHGEINPLANSEPTISNASNLW